VSDTSRRVGLSTHHDGQQARSPRHLAPSKPSCQIAGSQQVGIAAGDDLDLLAVWRGRRAMAGDRQIAQWCVALAVIGLISVVVLGLTGPSATAAAAATAASAIATTALMVVITYLRTRQP
jgi:hypothetical protein